MFGYDNVHTEVLVIADPQGDGTFPIWKAPTRNAKVEILEAWASVDTAVTGDAGTAFTLRLLDYGAAGTAVGGTISATLGAAGTGDWAANTPRDFTITEGTLDGGDYLCLSYVEDGTIAPANISVGFSWVSGVGA